VEIFKDIYSSCSAIIIFHEDSEKFPVTRGVKQADVTSPKLLTALLESIFQKLDWESKSICIDDEHLNNLRFADVIAIPARNPQKLKTMLNDLDQESQKVGLKMNNAKTKVMFNNHTNSHQLNKRRNGETTTGTRRHGKQGYRVIPKENH
jgi:hypothetical protein